MQDECCRGQVLHRQARRLASEALSYFSSEANADVTLPKHKGVLMESAV